MEIASHLDHVASVYEELEKLREANQMAQFVMENRHRNRDFPAVTPDVNDTIPDAQEEPVVMKKQSTRHSEVLNDDIWGASQYLTDDDDKIPYVKQYLKNTDELLQRDKELLKIAEPTDYEIVDDIGLLSINSNKSCNYESLHHIDNDKTEQHFFDVLLSENENSGVEEENDHVLSVSMNLLPSNNENPIGSSGNSESKYEIDKQNMNLEDNLQNGGNFSTSSASSPPMMSLVDENEFSSHVVDRQHSNGIDTSFLDHLLHTEDDLLHQENLKEKDQQHQPCNKKSCDSDKSIEVIKETCFLDHLLHTEDDFLPQGTLKEKDQQHRLCTKKSCDSDNSIEVIKEISFLYHLRHTEDNFLCQGTLKEKDQRPQPYNKTSSDSDKSIEVIQKIDDTIGPTLFRYTKEVENEKPLNFATDNLEKATFFDSSKENFLIPETSFQQQCPGRNKLNLYKTNWSVPKISKFSCVWDILPDEMILNIFSYLSKSDLMQLSLTNHRFYNLTKDSCLWHRVEASDMELSSELFEKFQSVKPRHIHFHRCSAKGLSAKVLRNFFQNCKTSLRHLHVSECMHESLFGDNILLHASSHCNKVESISVPWSNTTDNGVSALASLVSLINLDISGNCFISDESFILLVKKIGNSLQKLKVNGCFALTCKSFLAIAENCCNVKTLEIGLCAKATSECVQTLAKFVFNVKELDLRGLKSVNDECLTVISKHCKSLSKLVLANCALITDTGLSDLAFELPKIKDLDISGCSNVTDAGISTLATGFSNLVLLNLSSTSITYVSIITLTENCYDSLEVLKLSFCNNITEDCVKKLISFCYKLNCLHLHGCKRVSVKSLRANHKTLKIFS
ncbi:uncharacterized protein LOC120331469 [Styela clava]